MKWEKKTIDFIVLYIIIAIMNRYFYIIIFNNLLTIKKMQQNEYKTVLTFGNSIIDFI